MRARLVLHRLLILLVSLLVFEGLGRKWLGSGIANSVIFFGKDLICITLLLVTSQAPRNQYLSRLSLVVFGLALAMLPLTLFTAYQDVVLAAFGTKQYLLWSSVLLAVVAAYVPDREKQFFRLLTWTALLVIPTTCVAVYQQRLPASHWLNRTPDGASTEGFSAAGMQRVSGTFSFVAQYCMFLNALCFAIPASMMHRSVNSFVRVAGSVWVLIPLLLIGTFITGSRGAVVGNTAIVATGLLVLLARGGGRATGLAFGLTTITVLSLLVLRDQFPEFFVAYDARSQTVDGVTHVQQIFQRVTVGVLGWTEGLPPRAPGNFFGYGLGVMSNGSASLSSYAANWRMGDFWTETDQSTTLFEGGYYLVLVWYGLRIGIIARTILWTLQIKQLKFLLPAAFATGFVVVIGLIGTLSIQPPVAIWWWMAVGTAACLHSFDADARRKKAAKNQALLSQ